MGMLGTAAYILAMDTFGPIADNAGGIIEMSQQSEEMRRKTDRLDAVGQHHQGPDQRLCHWQRRPGGVLALLGVSGRSAHLWYAL